MNYDQIKSKVLAKIEELGNVKAAEFFNSTPLVISNWVKGANKIPIDVFKYLPELGEKEVVEVFNSEKCSSWEGKDVQILSPIYKAVNSKTMFCMIESGGRDRIGFDMVAGDAKIVNSRNKLATRFRNNIEKDAPEWSLWIDDDIIWPIGKKAWFKKHIPECPDRFAAMHAVTQIVANAKAHNKTIVSGVYFGRHNKGKAVYGDAIVDKNEDKWAHMNVPSDKFKQISWAGTGFLLVHRQVYLDLERKFPELDPPHGGGDWQYFTPTGDKMHFGEDQMFGWRANEAGHPTFIDCSIVLGHMGEGSYSVWNTQKVDPPIVKPRYVDPPEPRPVVRAFR